MANEHIVKLKKSKVFDKDSFYILKGSGNKKVQGIKIPTSISVIWGKLKRKIKVSDPIFPQALKFSTNTWTKTSVKNWLKENKIKFILFENAKKETVGKSINELSEISTTLFNGRNIFLFETFTNEMAKGIVQELIRLDSVSNLPINILINSFGGSVIALNSILDGFNLIKSPLNTIVTGDADSAGAVLFSAGDSRYVGENSRIMLHEISALALGGFRDMEDQMEQYEKVNDKLIAILSKNTGKTKEELKSLLYKKDIWLNAKEAVDFGIADDILTSEKRKKISLDSPLRTEIQEFNFSEGTELSEVPVLKVGEYENKLYGNFKITKEDLLLFKKNFEMRIRGIDLSIDYTHDNDDGSKEAAGWYKSMYLTKNGMELWANVNFTGKAKDKLAKNLYRYFSPEFRFDYLNEKGEKFKNVLIGGTLTNRPFQKWEAIKLSEPKITHTEPIRIQEKEKKTMDINQLKEALFNHGIDVDTLQDKAIVAENLEKEKKELTEKVNEKEIENKKLLEKNQVLSNEKTMIEKKSVFNALILEGKVFPAMEEKTLILFKTADEMKAYFTDMPKLLHTNAKGTSEAKKDSDKEIPKDLSAQALKLGLNKEDLEKGLESKQKNSQVQED